MASITLKGKTSWYANSLQAPSLSLHDTGRPQRAQKQGQKRSVVAASAPVSYPHDNEWLQDKHVITFLAERAYLNVVDEPLAWNYLVRAIMRHREMTEANARKSNWLQRRHFMLVNSEAHDVERGSQQGCHWFVVAFDGRKVPQAGFIVFPWDPKATNEYMSSFLDSCKGNDIEVRAKALRHQPVGDNWTCGYPSLGYICLLARAEIGTDLGALVLPPMAADFVGQVQACLREAAMTSSDTVDETLSGVTGAVASVRVNTQLWLAEMHGVPQTFHWVQVKLVGRKCQGLVPWEYVRPPYAKVRAPLKHLFATMTVQMQRICGKRPKTNHPSLAQAAEPSPSTPSALEHAPAQVSEPSAPSSPSMEHASAPVTEPSPSPSPPLEHGPAQSPKPSPSPSSPLHGPSVKSVPKDLHRKASKGDKVCAVTTCVQGTRVFCIGVRGSRWRALSARSSGRLIRNQVLIPMQMCFLLRQLHGLLFIAFQVLIVHQRPLCIQTPTTKLQAQKRPCAQLHR